MRAPSSHACANELAPDTTSRGRVVAHVFRRRVAAALNAAAARADNAGMFRSRWLLAALLGLTPASAFATAGFAERHADLAYNDLATVHWIHPGDGCDCGSTCFQVVRKHDRFGRFAGLECSLSRLSVPASRGQSLVLAQCCTDGVWLVYDLSREQTLVRTTVRAEALARWAALGQRPPRLAEAARGARGLHQTWSSRIEDWAFLALMWLPVLLPLVFVAGLFRFVAELRRYLVTRRVIHLMWCGVMLLPALSVAWFVFRVVFGGRGAIGH